MTTGTPVREHGIYQSSCGCRTALTVFAGQPLPTCLGCDEAVEWKLVQRIRPSSHPVRAPSSSTRIKAARPRLDSASGED